MISFKCQTAINEFWDYLYSNFHAYHIIFKLFYQVEFFFQESYIERPAWRCRHNLDLLVHVVFNLLFRDYILLQLIYPWDVMRAREGETLRPIVQMGVKKNKDL